MNRRIVCAACRCAPNITEPQGVTILGIRHWDSHMREAASWWIDRDEWNKPVEQGFVDNHGNFLTRTEAWKVAEAAGQIIRRVGGDEAGGGTLYSENLY